MKNHRSLLLGLGCVIALSGCVIVTDRDDWEDSDRDSWSERQRDNREYIADLRLGTPVEHVRSDLGRPDFSESFIDDQGSQVLVLRYRTHHRHSDGETTADETTPLVFINDELIGWGENALPEGSVADNY
ncbi:MAG: DUF3192 domain-containing protein [Xanthomonadales bacterium]|nr:DUF3192 domain-containing protein [Xanthomonadales bacterium]